MDARGRQACRPHCEQREDARRQVEQRMDGLAQDAQAARQQTHDELGHHEHDADRHRAKGDELRAALEPLHTATLSARLRAAQRAHVVSATRPSDTT